MKKPAICLFFLLIVLPGFAQHPLPKYLDVVHRFYQRYSFKPDTYYHQVKFAKKKEGWLVNIVDPYNDDSLIKKQLFWDAQQGMYKPLTDFAAPDRGQDAAIAENLLRNDLFAMYGYERSPYFGYNEWDADVIKDFSATLPANDTLLEGLGRAYAYHAERYMWYTMGGSPFDGDPLKEPVGKLALPSKERIDKFTFYIDKAIECYAALAKRNPGYRTVIGPVTLKVVNEQLHKYQVYLIAGYDELAKEAITKTGKNELYRQMGFNYLDGCPANSILITFGDNDTYGCWYLQQQGFRQDVTVLNYNLLGFGPYANMLRKNKSIKTTIDLTTFGTVDFSYFPFIDNKNAPASTSLASLVNDLNTRRYPDTSLFSINAGYKTKDITLAVDPERFKKIYSERNIAPVMKFTLGSYLELGHVMLLDIIQSNLYDRPICLATDIPLVKDHLQAAGSVYRVLPLDSTQKKATLAIEVKAIEKYLTNHYKPFLVSFNEPGSTTEDGHRNLHTGLYQHIIDNYTALGDKAAAKKWAKIYLNDPATKKIAGEVSGLGIAEALLKLDMKNEAVSLLEKIADHLRLFYTRTSSLEFYSRENVTGYLRYIDYLLTSHQLESKKVKAMLKELD